MAGADEAWEIPQIPAQTPQAPEQKPGEPVPVNGAGEQPMEQTPQAPGFGERGRMRRRARFLRRARELAYRDLGGLVFDLHRFGQRNDPVVLAKLATLGHIDAELRALEEALRDLKPVTVLREVGIAACPRCAAIHGSDDHFCPGCGLAFDAGAERPLSTAPIAPPVARPGPGATVAASTLGQFGNQPAYGYTQPAHTPGGPVGSPSPFTPAHGQPVAPGGTPPDLSISRPPSVPAEPVLPVKPTATPVPAKPAFPGIPQPSSTPEPVSPPTDSSKDGTVLGGAPAGTPFTPTASQPASVDSVEQKQKPEDEQKREPEDEPTQILRPPARGA